MEPLPGRTLPCPGATELSWSLLGVRRPLVVRLGAVAAQVEPWAEMRAPRVCRVPGVLPAPPARIPGHTGGDYAA